MNHFNPKLLLAAGAALLIASPALASSTSTSASATTKAQIVDPLTLTKNVDLDYGTLVRSALAGPTTVSISGADIVTCAPGLLCSGVTSAAHFTASGSPNQLVKVSLFVSNLSNGFDTVAFTPSFAPTVTLDGSGSVSFAVGGDLAIDNVISAGVYNGTMDVTVDYN